MIGINCWNVRPYLLQMLTVSIRLRDIIRDPRGWPVAGLKHCFLRENALRAVKEFEYLDEIIKDPFLNTKLLRTDFRVANE